MQRCDDASSWLRPGSSEVAASDAAARSAEAWADVAARRIPDGSGDDSPRVPSTRSTGDLVTLNSIPFVSVCSHHLLPFFGHAHVAYLPGERLLGLGRIEELVYCLSRRLQLAGTAGAGDRLRNLPKELGARGAAYVFSRPSTCVSSRGVSVSAVRSRERQRLPATCEMIEASANNA